MPIIEAVLSPLELEDEDNPEEDPEVGNEVDVGEALAALSIVTVVGKSTRSMPY